MLLGGNALIVVSQFLPGTFLFCELHPVNLRRSAESLKVRSNANFFFLQMHSSTLILSDFQITTSASSDALSGVLDLLSR